MGKFFLVQNYGRYYSCNMFRICKTCDFEWHYKDGEECPVCDKAKEMVYSETTPSNLSARAFGTGANRYRTKTWYTVLGIIALVGVIYSFVLR
jgi:hypothetical protein